MSFIQKSLSRGRIFFTSLLLLFWIFFVESRIQIHYYFSSQDWHFPAFFSFYFSIFVNKKDQKNGLLNPFASQFLNAWTCLTTDNFWEKLAFLHITIENVNSEEASWKVAWCTEHFSLWWLKCSETHETSHDEANTGLYFLLCLYLSTSKILHFFLHIF